MSPRRWKSPANARRRPLPVTGWTASAWPNAGGTIRTSCPAASNSQGGSAARALARRTRRLLFADGVPTGNLDAENAAAVAELMFDLVARAGAALVLVTHDLALAARADRGVAMADGRIVGAA